MLGIQNKARRAAIESRKSSDGNPQASQNEDHPASTGYFYHLLNRGKRPSDSSKTPTITDCGEDCWLRQLKVPEKGAKLPDLVISRRDDPRQDELTGLNMKVYESLRPWQTRLIVLEPGELGSDICCQLITVDVIDGPGLGVLETSNIVTYEALSYSWGYPALTCSITCNGKPFGITEELAFALQYLRQKDTQRYLWCDAICIAQHNIPEKSHQVKNMLRIFEKADRVIAWIGRPRLSTTLFFSALDIARSRLGGIPAQNHAADCEVFGETLAHATGEHLSSAWFTRTWIRQEVYAAKRMILQVGQDQMDFAMFLPSLALIAKTLAAFRAPSYNPSLPKTLAYLEDEYQHFGSDGPAFTLSSERPSYVQYWLDIVDIGLRFDVTDERDRIYGALGLLTGRTVRFFAEAPEDLDNLAVAFPIDYSKQLTEVHEDVTKFLINTTKSLEIFDYFHDRALTPTSPATPSWGIDYAQRQRRFHVPESRNQAAEAFNQARIQDYKEVGILGVSGRRVAKRILRLDVEKDIGHPQDRFMPRYRRAITLRQILHGAARRASGGLSSGIDNPPVAFVFSHMIGSSEQHLSQIACDLVKPEELPPAFTKLLSSSSYAFAYVEDFQSHQSHDLASLHFLVPRTASLDDVIVSLHGSRCLHLLRPLPPPLPSPPQINILSPQPESPQEKPEAIPVATADNEYNYLGPVAAVAIGQESINKYHSAAVAMHNTFPFPSKIAAKESSRDHGGDLSQGMSERFVLR